MKTDDQTLHLTRLPPFPVTADSLPPQQVVEALCIPYGLLQSVHVPLDAATGQHRGFAYVTFQHAEDAAQALDNLHDAELFSSRIEACLASVKALRRGRAVWDSHNDQHQQQQQHVTP